MRKHSTNDVAFLFWLTLLAFLLLFALLQPDLRRRSPRPEVPRQQVPREEPAAPAPRECTPRADCCRVCNQGKACGGSCIRRSLECHKPDGCACDAEDVCE